MIAIRIEHPKTGMGIFTHGAIPKSWSRGEGVDFLSNSDDFLERHSDFPTPYEDKGMNKTMNRDEYCAFKSMEQFKLWVTTPEIKEFIRMGFKILLLDLITCDEGEFQIVFKKTNISQIKDITELFID